MTHVHAIPRASRHLQAGLGAPRLAACVAVALALALTGPTVSADAPNATGVAARRAAEAELALRRTPIVDVYQRARRAVVNISSTRIVERRASPFDRMFDDMFMIPRQPVRLRRTSLGSGFVIHPDGYIVTNAHVVARSVELEVTFDDRAEDADDEPPGYEASIVAVDQRRDLALIKIDPPRPLPTLPLGRSDDLMVGETAIAIGNPLGYGHTVTSGVISATDRRLDITDELAFEGLIQTDASINPGNSGGPLLNILGELIGVNTAIRADAQNIGFAIPVDQLRQQLPEMLDVERRYGFLLGVDVDRRDEALRIERVVPGSPADRAGLRPGTRVLRVNDQPVARGIDFAIALVGRRVGERVTLTVTSDAGEPRTLALTLAERPAPDGAELLADKLGLAVAAVPERLARPLRLRRGVGLLITGVQLDGPADRAGMERGDLLLQIGRHAVTGLDAVGERLEQIDAGAPVDVVAVRIDRGRVVRYVARMKAR